MDDYKEIKNKYDEERNRLMKLINGYERDKYLSSNLSADEKLKIIIRDMIYYVDNKFTISFYNRKFELQCNTGLLWIKSDFLERIRGYQDKDKVIESYNLGLNGFRVPQVKEIRSWCGYGDRGSYLTYDNNTELIYDASNGKVIHADDLSTFYLQLCAEILIKDVNYPSLASEEKAELIVKFMISNKLLPSTIYSDSEFLIADLLGINRYQEELDSLVNPPIVSSEIDFMRMIMDYDVHSINKSVIQYYGAVHKWVTNLMDNLNGYERKNELLLTEIKRNTVELSKKYKNSECFLDVENELFRNRQQFLREKISIDLSSVRTKLLCIRKEADDFEKRIEEINNGENIISKLADLENEKRASFEIVAENTITIVMKALRKVEYYAENQDYIRFVLDTCENWHESYKQFKTTYFAEIKELCSGDGIEEEIWKKWYSDWRELRFSIEKKFQPMIEKELCERIPVINDSENTVSQQIVTVLEEYKKDIDKFYREERKGIYQNFVFQANGEIQDKLETESRIYKLTAQFQKSLQNVIFNCQKSEDRIFILDWAGSLLDIQIDDIIELIADNDMKGISDTVLTEFSQLKQRSYEFYLADAKSYGEEQEKRDKEFNSLLFKMRKGIMTN